MKTIKVVKITLDSYNKLKDLGYHVEFVTKTLSPGVFIKYKYLKPRKKLTSKFRCLHDHTNKHLCKHGLLVDDCK